jgi:hypothetical protein
MFCNYGYLCFTKKQPENIQFILQVTGYFGSNRFDDKTTAASFNKMKNNLFWFVLNLFNIVVIRCINTNDQKLSVNQQFNSAKSFCYPETSIIHLLKI